MTNLKSEVGVMEEIEVGDMVWCTDGLNKTEWVSEKCKLLHIIKRGTHQCDSYAMMQSGRLFWSYEITTTDPHEPTKPDYADALPPGCEVWEVCEDSDLLTFKLDGGSVGHGMAVRDKNFRGLLYRLGDGSYDVKSIYPVWTLPNSNSVWFGYMPDRIEAELVGCVMKKAAK